MRGSTPLDVAASSVMDNNGLALALEEPDLEKVREEYWSPALDGQTCEYVAISVRAVLVGGYLPGRLWSPELSNAPG